MNNVMDKNSWTPPMFFRNSLNSLAINFIPKKMERLPTCSLSFLYAKTSSKVS